MTVGDVVTRNYIKTVLDLPDIAVIDMRSRRRSYLVGIERLYHGEKVARLATENPPGHVTTHAIDTLRNAVALAIKGFKVLVTVKGEEDLLLGVLSFMSPPRWALLYGHPILNSLGIVVTCPYIAAAMKRFFDVYMEKII